MWEKFQEISKKWKKFNEIQKTLAENFSIVENKGKFFVQTTEILNKIYKNVNVKMWPKVILHYPLSSACVNILSLVSCTRQFIGK